jgi:hypothetical protein
MGGAEPDRRGIANGGRSMLQNTGYAVSTAMSLAVLAGVCVLGMVLSLTRNAGQHTTTQDDTRLRTLT